VDSDALSLNSARMGYIKGWCCNLAIMKMEVITPEENMEIS
jgi:hypothetical protein